MSTSLVTTKTYTDAGPRHCLPVDIDWQPAEASGQTAAAQGVHLAIAISIFKRDEKSVVLPEPQGEEVATVLEGAFLVEAAGERYQLSPGEGIIIPPREPRVWTCQSVRGVLYRVTTRLDALPAEEGATA